MFSDNIEAETAAMSKCGDCCGMVNVNCSPRVGKESEPWILCCTDPLVKALVECEKLMRRENTLKDQLKRMENERHEMRQNNDVQGSRHVDVNKK